MEQIIVVNGPGTILPSRSTGTFERVQGYEGLHCRKREGIIAAAAATSEIHFEEKIR